VSKWLARALAEIRCGPRVPIVPLGPIGREGHGPSDTSSSPEAETAPDSFGGDLDERAAMAIEGGVPPLYVSAFAALQALRPVGLDDLHWLQAIDDAGRFLDAWGRQAEALGWPAASLFKEGGLVAALRGRPVIKLVEKEAVISGGEVFVCLSVRVIRSSSHNESKSKRIEVRRCSS
jgi:hypothetical protein